MWSRLVTVVEEMWHTICRTAFSLIVSEAQDFACDLLDARGQYVLPGNLCAHTHFYGAFARGLAIPGDPPQDFPEFLVSPLVL